MDTTEEGSSHMIDLNQIPDEVVEALCNHVGPVMTRADWRAAFAAGLNAWEGAFPHTFRGPLEGYGLVLPLPKENANGYD
jgi:hypothetical protein